MRKITIDGHKLYLSETLTGLSSYLWSGKPYEPAFMWLLKKEGVGDLALDIGSNIGYSTITLCKKMKRVIAIEPDPRSRKVLEKNIKAHKFSKKVKVHSFAMSDSNSKKMFYLSKHPNLSAFVKNRKYRTKGKKVVTRTIDSLGVDPNFIKMDIEGYEVEVLRGGFDSLERTKKCKILLEVHPKIYSEERDFSSVLRDLVKMGYSLKCIVSAGYSPFYLFEEKGYKPFKTFKCGKFNRCIFKDIGTEDFINFSTKMYCISGKMGKIVRAIMIEK